MDLENNTGQRKYLSRNEVHRFLEASERFIIDINLLCKTLVYSGCRISEITSMTVNSLDIELCCVRVRSLKKRDRICYRNIPFPKMIFDEIHKFAQLRKNLCGRIW